MQQGKIDFRGKLRRAAIMALQLGALLLGYSIVGLAVAWAWSNIFRDLGLIE